MKIKTCVGLLAVSALMAGCTASDTRSEADYGSSVRQVINSQTIDFMRKLDVKEIHGFSAALGLKLLNPAFLQATAKPRKSEQPKQVTSEHKRAASAD